MIIENEKRSIDGMICSVFENVKGLMETNTVVGKFAAEVNTARAKTGNMQEETAWE